MNILILSWRGLKHPQSGGAEISTHEHAKGWVKAGHNVTLFTSAFVGCKKEEVIDGVNIKRRGQQILEVHLKAFIWYLFGRHPKFDLVIDEFHGIPFFTPLYVQEKKLAFIHEATKEVWRLNSLPRPFNYIAYFLGSLIEQYIFKLFYKDIPFVTGSDSTKKDLICWGIPNKNITIINYGFSPPKVKVFQKGKIKTAIFLGALTEDKGIEDALRIFSVLNNSYNDFQFWVVGKSKDSYLNKLKMQANESGLDKKIRFFGFVNEDRKYKLLGKSHILVNPSVREGWGLTVIEAASVGTPTIGYNVAGLRDSILNNKTGILCEPRPEVCAQKIVDLLKDEESYSILIKNCIKYAKKFSWENSCKDSVSLIENL